MKKIIGYTQGVFDLFHIGHLNLLKAAKENCDYLIVGVNSDSLVKKYKNITPIIDEDSRLKIIESIKYVDECFIAETLDKERILDCHYFDIVFIGDDWKNNERWKATIEQLDKRGKKVIFLPYTKSISSTKIRQKIK